MNADRQSAHRLIIVSNRLPVVLRRDAKGRWYAEPGSGGLVTAMAPVLRRRGGLWIGWPGTPANEQIDLESLLNDAVGDFGYHFKGLQLSQPEVAGYYYGFANEILWPLFHDLQTRCNFKPEYWDFYWKVNRKFAESIAGSVREETHDHIWVHDYHLIGVGLELRRLGLHSKIGYFLHIPFPPLDLFLKLPWRYQMLNALLAYDLVGFQTDRDKRNFLHCIRSMRKDVRVRGRGRVATAEAEGRVTRIGNFPISIDFEEFAGKAQSREVEQRADQIRENLGSDTNQRTLLLGVDRLDYTKGIPERLKAFANALDRFPALRRKICLFQIVVPSRVSIPKYMELQLDIERLVSRINGKYAQTDWVPVHYIFRSVERGELVAFYRAADIALITPLKDGMNLVAKEYCAANVNENGVLVMSEFAGAASQLHPEAILVNPYDLQGVADAIAFACDMPLSERQRRMKALRRKIRKFDIFWWVDTFLDSIFAHQLQDFPILDENYVPAENGHSYFHAGAVDRTWMNTQSLLPGG